MIWKDNKIMQLLVILLLPYRDEKFYASSEPKTSNDM